MTHEAIYCYDTGTVRFAIYPDGLDGARVLAEIGEHALRDLFGARGGSQSLLSAYGANAAAIDALALQHYRAAPQAPIVLETASFTNDSLA